MRKLRHPRTLSRRILSARGQKSGHRVRFLGLIRTSLLGGSLSLIIIGAVVLNPLSVSTASATSSGSGLASGDLEYVEIGPGYCYYYSNSIILTGTLDTGSYGTVALGPWSSDKSTSYFSPHCGSNSIASVTYDATPTGGKSVTGTCSGTISLTREVLSADPFGGLTLSFPTIALSCTDGKGNGGLHGFALTINGTSLTDELADTPYAPLAGTYTMD